MQQTEDNTDEDNSGIHDAYDVEASVVVGSKSRRSSHPSEEIDENNDNRSLSESEKDDGNNEDCEICGDGGGEVSRLYHHLKILSPSGVFYDLPLTRLTLPDFLIFVCRRLNLL